MPNVQTFKFKRARGIVWVCDLENSSRYLNNNESADDLEMMLPRLYWLATGLVEAAGGRFIKWTGDGFIAWFNVELHRNIGFEAATVFSAAWYLTFLLNVTQLGLSPKHRFTIRHGIVYEQDALLIHIEHNMDYSSLDLIGRGVVLASRLASVPGEFPNITTHEELVGPVHLARGVDSRAREQCFRKWSVRPDERLRYFKNERWGTLSLYKSSQYKAQSTNVTALRKRLSSMLKETGKNPPDNHQRLEFCRRLITFLHSGPDWCESICSEFMRFVEEDMTESVLCALEFLGKVESRLRKMEREAPAQDQVGQAFRKAGNTT